MSTSGAAGAAHNATVRTEPREPATPAPDESAVPDEEEHGRGLEQ